MKREKYKEQTKCKTLEELVALGKARGYSEPQFWAQQIWDARQKNKRKFRYKTKKAKF